MSHPKFLKLFYIQMVTMGLLLGFTPQQVLSQEINQETSQKTLSLKQAIQQVIADSPRLAAQRKQAQALHEVAPQVSSLPDPMLSVNALNLPTNSFSSNQEAMTQWQVGISQAIPSLGKLSLRADIAEQIADIADLNVDEVRLKLVERVQNRWWNVFYLDQAVATVLKNQDLLRQLIRIAETKYKVGQGLQQDVLLAQVELSKLLDLEIQLKSSRHQEAARLNALLHQPIHQAIVLPHQRHADLKDMNDASALFDYALNHRPLLAQANTRIETMQNRVDLAKEDNNPDFNVGGAYGFRSGHNANGSRRANLMSVRVSMTLPWFTQDKQDHQVEQRRANLAEAEFDYDDVKDAVLSEVSQTLDAYKQSKQQSLLFKYGIIPQSQQTVASMRAAYQVNKVDFLNLVRAQITLYNYEIQYWKVYAQAKQSEARLHHVMGKEFENE